MIPVLYTGSYSLKSWDRLDGISTLTRRAINPPCPLSFSEGIPLKIRRLCPPRHRGSPLPKRPRYPTSRLSIPSTTLQILDLFSSAFAALILPLSSPLRRSQNVLVLSVLPYLPLHRQYCEQFQTSPDMVQLQPQSGASPTPFRQTLLRFGHASE